MHLRHVLFSSALAALAPLTVGAQGASASRTRAESDAARECMRHIPPSDMTRVMVYVSADVADPKLAASGAGPDASAAADALASAVADHIRLRLGAPVGVLPNGDSLMTWVGFGPDLNVVARRGRQLHWDYDELGEVSDGTGLIARGLADAVAEGETFVWPENLRADSVVIHMRLHAPEIARDGTAQPITAHAAVAVFTLPVPWEEPLERLEPAAPLHLNVERGWLDGPRDGFVELGVIIDTTGRVDPDVIRELAPLDDNGRPAHALARVWKAARERALEVRFRPHRIGGCAIPTPFPMVMSFSTR